MVKINVLLGNGGWVAGKVRALATEIASAISPSPVIHKNPASWAVKNTMFASQTFMLAATAHGLGVAPMEGFDERRLCYALNIPMERYTVPLIVSIGYAPKVVKSYGVDKTKRRHPLEDMCFTDKFDNAWRSSVPAVDKK
jgi:nitroreductase